MYIFNHFPGGVHLHPSQKKPSRRNAARCRGGALELGSSGEILRKLGLFEREKCGKIVRLYWDIPVNYGKNVEKLWKNVEKTSKKVGKYEKNDGKSWDKRSKLSK